MGAKPRQHAEQRKRSRQAAEARILEELPRQGHHFAIAIAVEGLHSTSHFASSSTTAHCENERQNSRMSPTRGKHADDDLLEAAAYEDRFD